MSASKSGASRKGSSSKAKKGPNLKIPAAISSSSADVASNEDVGSNTSAAPATKAKTAPVRSAGLQRTSFEKWLVNKSSRRSRIGDPSENSFSRAALWAYGAVVTALAFVLYLVTTAHYQVTGDTSDFLLASKTFGVSHPPGYPTLILLGHIFSWLPFGSTAFRIDLLATFCSAGTVALVYVTGVRLTRRPWAAALGASALAFTPLFWKWSLQIETFPLNNLLVAAVIYCVVCWHQEPERRRHLFVAGLLFGVGLTNQQTMLLMAPAIAYVLWLNRRTLLADQKVIGWAALWVVAGLVPYLYVPFAAAFGHSPDNWDHASSLVNLFNLITRSDYGGTTVNLGSARHSGQFFLAIWFLFQQIGIVLGISVLVGALASLSRLRWYFVFSVIAFGFSILEFAVVSGLDPHVNTSMFVLERFYLMPMVVLAPLAAVGVVGLADWFSERRMMLDVASAPHIMAALLGVAIVAASAAIVTSNYTTINVSHDKVTENYVRDALGGLPEHAVLFVTGDFADFPILYAQSVEGVRRDVTVIVSPLLGAPWYISQLRAEHRIDIPHTVTTRAIVAANPSSEFFFIGQPPDKTLTGYYYFANQGLTSEIVPQAQNLNITTYAAQNNALLAQYHVPSYKKIKRVSFESFILDAYANIPASLGGNYGSANSIGLAIKYYEQAHAMDPRNEVVIKELKKLKAGAI